MNSSFTYRTSIRVKNVTTRNVYVCAIMHLWKYSADVPCRAVTRMITGYDRAAFHTIMDVRTQIYQHTITCIVPVHTAIRGCMQLTGFCCPMHRVIGSRILNGPIGHNNSFPGCQLSTSAYEPGMQCQVRVHSRCESVLCKTL